MGRNVNLWPLWSERMFRGRRGWEFKIDKQFAIFMTKDVYPSGRQSYMARLLTGTGRKQLVRFSFPAGSENEAAEEALERMRAYLRAVAEE